MKRLKISETYASEIFNAQKPVKTLLKMFNKMRFYIAFLFK